MNDKWSFPLHNHPSKVGAFVHFSPHYPLEYILVFAICLIRYGYVNGRMGGKLNNL